MIVIQKNRNCGKTVELVSMLENNPNAVLLVHNGQERIRIIHSFCLTPNQANRIFTWNSYPKGGFQGFNHQILIDNIDLYIQERFDFKVLGVSINKD